MDRRQLLCGLSCGLGLSMAGCVTPPHSGSREPTVTRLEESTVTAFDDWRFADAVEKATSATTLVQFGSSADSHSVDHIGLVEVSARRSCATTPS